MKRLHVRCIVGERQSALPFINLHKQDRIA